MGSLWSDFKPDAALASRAPFPVFRAKGISGMRLPESARRFTPFWTVYRIPVWLGVITCVGLGAGVLGDDLWDLVSWAGLAIPLVILVWFLLKPAEAAAARPAKGNS